METLKEHLRTFKLAGMLMAVEERMTYANDKQLSYGQFLELLCEDEANNRNDIVTRSGTQKQSFLHIRQSRTLISLSNPL